MHINEVQNWSHVLGNKTTKPQLYSKIPKNRDKPMFYIWCQETKTSCMCPESDQWPSDYILCSRADTEGHTGGNWETSGQILLNGSF